MKEGWTYKKLGEVAQVQNGFAFDSKLFNEAGKGTPLIRIRDIKRGYSYTYTTENCDKDFYIEDGALLVGMDGDFNVCTWKGGHSYLNQRVCHIIPSKLIVSRFLYYLLPYPLQKINDKTSFSTVKHLSSKQVNAIMVPVPPLDEQQRIVSRLDSAFAHIDELKANAEKQVNEARALFQKALTKAMEPKEGWEEKKLGDLGDFKNGMNFAHNEKGVYLHLLGVGDFEDRFSIDNIDELQIISLNQQPSDEYLLKDGDIVFVRSNGNKQLVGRSLVVYPNDIPTTFSGFCIRFRKSSDNVDEKFLVYFLKSEETRKKLFGNGANISNLNQKILQSLVILLPPLSEQQRIVERLDSISENVRNYEDIQRKIIAECDALKQALLRQVFN